MVPFEPQIRSLRTHEVPDWYHDAKLGIFIHWGLFSVPGWAPLTGTVADALREHYDDFLPLSPYAEWYENALKFPDSPTARHHAATYGNLPYAGFKEPFEESLKTWEPDGWAELFRGAGARYVILVTKHHDGFCLWPSEVRNPVRGGWHTRRDLVGELAAAVRRAGMRFGVYYSGGIDWSFNPTPLRNPGDLLASVPERDGYPGYADAQVRELIASHAPEVLWNDIAWPTGKGPLLRLFADYYHAVPQGLVNDRWLHVGAFLELLRRRPARAFFNRMMRWALQRPGRKLEARPSVHFDYRTPEYSSFDSIQSGKWESTRGIGRSFGWNRNEPPENLIPGADLVRDFIDIVSKNGNLLLNVGPRGEDAAIPGEQTARLRELGNWLERNGEAIYGTRPWTRAEGRAAEGTPVRFTSRGADLYAILLDTPSPPRIRLEGLEASPTRVRWLGAGEAEWRRCDAGLEVAVPETLRAAPAHALVLESGTLRRLRRWI